MTDHPNEESMQEELMGYEGDKPDDQEEGVLPSDDEDVPIPHEEPKRASPPRPHNDATNNVAVPFLVIQSGRQEMKSSAVMSH